MKCPLRHPQCLLCNPFFAAVTTHTYAEEHAATQRHTQTPISPKQLKELRWSFYLNELSCGLSFSSRQSSPCPPCMTSSEDSPAEMSLRQRTGREEALKGFLRNIKLMVDDKKTWLKRSVWENKKETNTDGFQNCPRTFAFVMLKCVCIWTQLPWAYVALTDKSFTEM